MDRWWESPMYCNEWSLWFAWRPVTLLTMEVAWLRGLSVTEAEDEAEDEAEARASASKGR